MGGRASKFVYQVDDACRVPPFGGPCGGMHLFREWGVDPANHTVRPTPCGSPSLGPQSGAHRPSATATLRAATFLAFPGFISCFQVLRRPAAPIEFCRPHAPSGLELDPFHYLEVFSCTAQFAFRLTGVPEHATTLSSLQRLVDVACLLTLATGAGVGGWAPKFFAGLPAAKVAKAVHSISSARRTELWVWWHAVACHWV